MKRATLSLIVVTAIFSLAPLAASALEVRQIFNPNILIPDASFNDTKTFGGPEGIQRFLESRSSVLASTSPDFLVKLSEPADPALKQTLNDPEPNLGRLRTAAELIWDASCASGLNPQVTLVTLQKEQGLIGNVATDRLQRALNHAMGFDCPDSSGCGNLFPGFYYQLFGNVDTEGNRYLGAAKSLMRSFTTPGGRGPLLNGQSAKVGDTVTITNTLGDYDGITAAQTVTLGNLATAALYRYTPHVFNGNYNFWNYFTSWFKYPNGTLLRSTVDNNTYIISDGQLRRVPTFVAVARGLHPSQAMPASPNELSDYPVGPTYGPTDGTLISLNGVFYVFRDGVKHPATSFVITQRRLDPAQIMPITADDAALFPEGSQLLPTEGTIVRGQSDSTIYRAGTDALQRFSDFTLKQYGATKLAQVIPDSEIALYPKVGYVPPKNGTLIKGPTVANVYVMSEGRRSPLTSELFKSNGYRTKDVVTLTTDAELASIPMGPPAPPREGTYFAMDKEFYVFKSGAKHQIFPFVAKQRYMTPDYTFEASLVSNWPDGIAVPPRDGTLLKSASSPTVYVVKKGQLRPLTATIFRLQGFQFKNVVTVDDATVTAFAKDGYAEPPNNTYFQVTETGEFYRFQDGAKRRIYPFVAKQRGMTPDYKFPAEVADDWTEGVPVAPKNGTLLQSDSDSQIYLVVNNVPRPISDAAFKRRGYRTKSIIIVPAADLAAFAKGDPITR